METTTLVISAVVIVLLIAGIIAYVLGQRGPKRLEEIQTLINAGKIKDAIKGLEAFLEEDDRNFTARYMLGICKMQLADYGHAVISLRMCLKGNRFTPDITEVMVRKNLAKSLQAVNNLNDAKNELLILTQLEPNNPEHHMEVGQLFLKSGVPQKAIKFFGQASQLNPRNADALYYLGQAQYQSNFLVDAKASLVKATQLKPELRPARFYLGMVLRQTGDTEWALKELEAAERDEKIKDRVLMMKGMTLMDMSQFPKAIAELERGLKVASNSEIMINMRYLIATAAEKMRDMAKAIDQWERIEAAKPNFRDVKQKLAQYSDLRVDDAIKDFVTANASQFESISRKMIERMGYSISEISVDGDNTVTGLGIETEASRGGTRKQSMLFVIQRELSPLSEKQIRDLHESMRTKNTQKGIFITAGEATPGAISFASSRPIEILDGQKTAEAVKSAVQS